VLTKWAREADTENGVRARATGADNPAPLGRERERERAREEETTADRWNPPVRQRGPAGARPGWAELGQLGCFGFFYFPRISNCFSISFL
jgi:hypothetical protein